MNSSQRLAARRYAAAYDALSRTNEEAKNRAEDLSSAARGLAGAQALLTNPCVSLAQKKQVLQEALTAAPQVCTFLEVLLAAKRYALLPEIVQQVEDLLDKRLGIVRAQVVSAQPLSAEEKTHVIRALEARYGKQVKAVFQTQKNLLGGLQIWCNGELIDGSMHGQLVRLQEELMK